MACNPCAGDGNQRPPAAAAARGWDGRQRRCARCVNGVVDAAQVQSVGDAPGDDVPQDAWKRILRQAGKPFVEFFGDLSEHLRTQHPQTVHAGQLVTGFGTEDHRRFFPVELFAVLAVPGRFQSLL